MKRLRQVLWALVALVSLPALALFMGWWQVDGPGAVSSVETSTKRPPSLGGLQGIVLMDQNGRSIDLTTWRGRPRLIFFGFTHCPDVCPTTLNDISEWFDALGAEAKDLRASFITVDPERDTITALKDYVSNFDKRITGFSGSLEMTAAVAERLGAYFKKVPTNGGSYTMDHTATIMLFRRDGSFGGTLDYHESRTTALPKIRRILQ